ncbi:hypothetical protein ACVWVQ_001421 [Thermostichus sp. MS-CIW-36]
MTPEQEEWLIRNLQQQQEQIQEMRASSNDLPSALRRRWPR